MELSVETETDALAERLNFLATVGSVAPFVGLFGTVWGIMNSFFQIGMQQNSSLAVVAPGISEALFATAIGLFAAIPAVIAYNRFSHRVNAYEAHLRRFADQVHSQVGRELERLFAEQGAPPATVHNTESWRVDGGSFNIAPGAPPEAVGAQVAQALHGGLSR